MQRVWATRHKCTNVGSTPTMHETMGGGRGEDIAWASQGVLFLHGRGTLGGRGAEG